MHRASIPGTAYGDCSPAGDWVCSAVGRPAIMTSWQGEIPAPAEMLSNRLHGRKIAAKTQSPGTVSVYDGRWLDTGLNSHGVQGHAWDDAGNLYILRAGPDQESMGLQFYDPSITSPHANFDVFHETPGFVTGSPAYGPTTALAQELGVARLFLWTKFGDVAVGQGDSGGTVIQYQGVHYLLEPGDSRFVQFHRDGDQLAVAITRFGQVDTVFHWLTVADIPRLPRYGTDPIEPEPEPDMWPNLLPTIELVRAKYPALINTEQSVAIVNEVCWMHRAEGMGLLAKPSGNRGPQPSTGKDCSVDWFCQQTTGLGTDGLGSTPNSEEGTLGPAIPQWGHGEPFDVSRWVAPVAPGGVVEPPPTNDGKHPYTRDDDDRDECNFIMPDGSQCDQPKAAEIHQVTTEPPPIEPPPVEPPPGGVVTNAQIMAQLKRLSDHLGLR